MLLKTADAAKDLARALIDRAVDLTLPAVVEPDALLKTEADIRDMVEGVLRDRREAYAALTTP